MDLTTEPLVHYVRDSSGDRGYPRICRTALIVRQPYDTNEGVVDLVVFDPEGLRFKNGLAYSIPWPAKIGGTWHRMADHDYKPPEQADRRRTPGEDLRRLNLEDEAVTLVDGILKLGYENVTAAGRDSLYNHARDLIRRAYNLS